jgi:hypothetical protein
MNKRRVATRSVTDAVRGNVSSVVRMRGHAAAALNQSGCGAVPLRIATSLRLPVLLLRRAWQQTGKGMCHKTEDGVGAYGAFAQALARVTPNQSFQPTSGSSLRSSPAAAELHR